MEKEGTDLVWDGVDNNERFFTSSESKLERVQVPTN